MEEKVATTPMGASKRIKRTFCAISVAVLVLSLLFSIFRFPGVFTRTLQAGKDLGLSLAYYFTEMFGYHDTITTTVNLIDESSIGVLPMLPGEIKARLAAFGELFVSKANLRAFGAKSNQWILIFCTVVIPAFWLVLAIILLPMITAKTYAPDKRNHRTVFLRAFERVELVVWVPVKKYLREYVAYVKEHKAYLYWFIAIWTYNLNLWAIVTETFGYALYLSVSFDIESIFTFLAKLAMDLTVIIGFFPTWAWVVIGVFTFECARRWLGSKKLDRLQKNNEKTLEENPGAIFIVGPPRAGKTLLLAAITRLIERIFRKQALKGMQKREKQFPHFPWVNVDHFYKQAREESHKLFIVAQYPDFLKKLRLHYKYRDRYEGEKGQFMREFLRWRYKEVYDYDFDDFIFNYDTKLYDVEYNNGIEIVDVFDAINGYISQLHIYATRTPLAFGNLSIRSDTAWKKDKVFPKYDQNFWKKNPREIMVSSQYCHIADQDMLRLGELVAEDNPYKDSLEFGVVAMTEYAKERGNQITNQGKKADDGETNVKNDRLEMNTKMQSHASTIDNYNFFRYVIDDQRAMALGADNRDLCRIVLIKERKSGRSALPLPWIEKLLEWVASKCYDKTHLEEKYNRSDYTLTMYLMRKIFTPIFNHVERMQNIYGYDEMRLNTTDGEDGTALQWSTYAVLHKDAYSAYATDTFKSFYHKKALRAKHGIDDVPQYRHRRMEFDEMPKLHSYLFNDMTKAFFGNAG